MTLDSSDSSELAERFQSLMVDYQIVSKDLADKLEKYGKIRKELQILLEEFQKRNIKLEEIEVKKIT